jgi:hypothetical protein
MACTRASPFYMTTHVKPTYGETVHRELTKPHTAPSRRRAVAAHLQVIQSQTHRSSPPGPPGFRSHRLTSLLSDMQASQHDMTADLARFEDETVTAFFTPFDLEVVAAQLAQKYHAVCIGLDDDTPLGRAQRAFDEAHATAAAALLVSSQDHHLLLAAALNRRAAKQALDTARSIPGLPPQTLHIAQANFRLADQTNDETVSVVIRNMGVLQAAEELQTRARSGLIRARAPPY